MEINVVWSDLNVFVPITAMVFGLLNYRKLNPVLKALLAYVALGALAEISNFVFHQLFPKENNMLIGNLYFFLSFLFLGIYYMRLFGGYIKRRYLIVLIVIYQLAFVFNFVFVQSVSEYPALLKGISDIVLMLGAVVYFHKTMVEASVKNIGQEPLIYSNLGLLLYFGGSLFHSLLFNLIMDYQPEFTQYSTNFFYFLLVVFYTLLAFAFWKVGKQKAAR